MLFCTKNLPSSDDDDSIKRSGSSTKASKDSSSVAGVPRNNARSMTASMNSSSDVSVDIPPAGDEAVTVDEVDALSSSPK